MAAKKPQFEVYKSESGGWNWRLRAVNGKVIAQGTQGYSRRGGALKAADMVRAALKGGTEAEVLV